MREKGLCSAGSRTFAEITRFMNLAAILLLGIGLSLDTFAVSLTLGFVSERTTPVSYTHLDVYKRQTG